MERAYVMIKGGLVREQITAERARELYDEAAAVEGCELTGDFSSGFGFWRMDEGLQSVRIRVERVPAEA